MGHVTKCDRPVCIVCFVVSVVVNSDSITDIFGDRPVETAERFRLGRRGFRKRLQRCILRPRLYLQGSMRGLVISPPHVIGRNSAGRKTHSHVRTTEDRISPAVQPQSHLCFYIDSKTLLFLSNGRCRVIFADLSLPLSLSLTYTRYVLVSSIPEAAGYAERKCDPAHAK